MKRLKMSLAISFSLLIGVRAFYRFYFLRDPIREIPNDNQVFVSPANGKIIAIIKQDGLKDRKTELYKKNRKVINDRTEGFSSGATLISIMMTPLDAHYQKAPMQATMLSEEYMKGRFWNAMRSNKTMKSTFQNEYHSMLFETPEKYQFRVIQIAGFVARRIVDFLDPWQAVQQGEKIWLIKLWSQVSIVLDQNFEITAKVGDKVIDGETVLAKKKQTR